MKAKRGRPAKASRKRKTGKLKLIKQPTKKELSAAKRKIARTKRRLKKGQLQY